jgi:ABC-type polysaccharide/polyol phosphate transport system ATPase subunit
MATVTPSPSSSETERSAGGLTPAIGLAGIHKRFRKFTVRGDYTTLKTSLLNRMFRRGSGAGHYVDVLNGIDLDVAPGTTLGIIGRNGSGKSTLLKVMAGIIRPDEGEVEVRGRISPLIELGAGFHPEFSGRENVFLNGLVIGMTKAETEERYDTIVEFAGLADVMDDPVRTYSSGMYMRLAFSVAVHADPEVLLIDEILAVGDEAFIAKCYDRIAAFQEAGKTIVMVSHGLESIIRWCHEAIWIDRGRIMARGNPTRVTRLYHEASSAGTTPVNVATRQRDSLSPGTLRAEIRLLDRFVQTLPSGKPAVSLLLEIENVGDTVWCSRPPTRRGTVTAAARVYGANDRSLGETAHALIPRDVGPRGRARVELLARLPEPGQYRLDVDLVDEEICWFSDRGSEPLRVDVSV